jgi:hypothetical protein
VAEQAGYLWQAFAEGRQAGVEVMFLFQLFDDCGNGPTSYDAFGLVRNPASNQCWIAPDQACWRREPALDGSPRPAYAAYQSALRELSGTLPLWHPARENDWQRVLLFRPPDKRVMLLWNFQRQAQTVDVFGTGPEAMILSPTDGGAWQGRTATPVAGKHRLELPGATNRNNPGNGAAVMPGLPVVVIERDTAPPFRAEIRPLAPLSVRPLTLTVAAADGGTGIASFQVFVATITPTTAADWQPLIGERAWSAPVISGEQRVSFEGAVGMTYYFTARARDRAGNLTALSLVPQAVTRLERALPPTLTPTPTRTLLPTPTRTLTPLALTSTATVPTRTATVGRPSPTPLPTATSRPRSSVTPFAPVGRSYLPSLYNAP